MTSLIDAMVSSLWIECEKIMHKGWLNMVELDKPMNKGQANHVLEKIIRNKSCITFGFD
jgi:hypothetical protein